MGNNYFEQRDVSSNMRFNLMMAGILSLLMLSVGCNKPIVPTDKGMESMIVDVPREMKNAEEDAAIARDGSRIVSLLNSDELYIGKEAYPKNDKDLFQRRIGEQVKGDAEQLIYLQVGQFVEYGRVADILNDILYMEAHNIALIVSGKSANQGGNSLRRFAVKLPRMPEPTEEVKPEKLALVVELKADGKIRLNQNDMGTVSQAEVLSTQLSSIFPERAANNIAEKTVTIKAAKRSSYVNVVKVIDAVKGAGGNPIILEIYDLSDK